MSSRKTVYVLNIPSQNYHSPTQPEKRLQVLRDCAKRRGGDWTIYKLSYGGGLPLTEDVFETSETCDNVEAKEAESEVA